MNVVKKLAVAVSVLGVCLVAGSTSAQTKSNVERKAFVDVQIGPNYPYLATCKANLDTARAQACSTLGYQRLVSIAETYPKCVHFSTSHWYIMFKGTCERDAGTAPN